MRKKLLLSLLAVALFLFPSVALASKYSTTTLKVGSSGTGVTLLQQDLQTLKYYTYPYVDGDYGAATADAVLRFQKDYGLYPYGVADLTTQNLLEKEINATVKVNLNGNVINFPDAQPYVTDSYRTLVPISFVSQALGLQVNWSMVENNNIKVVITGQGKTISLTTGSQTAYVNGQAVTLDQAAFIKRGRTHVPLRFVMDTFNASVNWDNANRTVVLWTVPQPSTPVTQKPTVIIDPGHGGKDTGAIGIDGTYEKLINLQFALKAQAEMVKRGYNTVLTRSTDVEVFPNYTYVSQDLQARVDFVKRYNAKLFVSIHQNSFTSTSAYGTETYYDTSKNPYPTKSQQLAGILQTKTTAAMKTYSRGTADNDFYVIRNNSVPAVLLEVGFMSNPDDLKKLKDPAYQNTFAVSFADGIEQYYQQNPY